MQMKRLLCVEDDADLLKSRKLVLEAAGYSVNIVDSAEDALRFLARDADVDLVILDYLMPGMNGDALAERLRQQYPHLPLVTVSAVGQLPQSFLDTTNASIQKGRDPQVLLSTVADILARTENSAPQSRLHKTVLCVDDEQSQLTLRKMLFESAGYRVLEARSAKTAMEAFRSSHVDAVVMDYWLSGQNGTAVAEEMKRMRPRVPIVMISGFTSLPGEGVVVDSWMRKAQTEPEDLIDEVNRLIALRTPRVQADKSE